MHILASWASELGRLGFLEAIPALLSPGLDLLLCFSTAIILGRPIVNTNSVGSGLMIVFSSGHGMEIYHKSQGWPFSSHSS